MTDMHTHYNNEREREESDIDHKVDSVYEAFKDEIKELKRIKKRIMLIAIAKGVEMQVEDMLREELML